ncbi:hypothetical protein GALMADRAFT_1169509 [Galerina marginata CBS 339.88]|uniref:Nephrocystin 3-like N-terminal domain-containing protein n=1 Tax=Galerina marginata (strain CBS 339.88) TaxID=685588 RepID=A0A067TC47_GALM3|nr:hypothetical protein GALMADRAFT_1169509 [Galerina marginata CBS 339.88]
MRSNPILHTKSIAIQMQTLIIEPFRKYDAPHHTATVIIDGLDECEGHESQKLLLTIIHEALAVHGLSLRFLVASRPEAHIRDVFDRTPFYTTTRRILLDESFQPNRDIEMFLRDGLKAIYERNPQLMAEVTRPWPAECVIDLLVQKASGQFIYAATVLKFVGDEFYHPTTQLDIVLEPAPSQATPFSDLDRLYFQILATYPHPRVLVRVLGFILALHCPQPPSVIEDLLSMKEGEVSLVLRGLHSLIRFPDLETTNSQGRDSSDPGEEYGLRVLHASFHDYLTDEGRSGPNYIALEEYRAEVTTHTFALLTKCISHHKRLNVRQPRHPQTWWYLKSHLSQHFWTSSEAIRNQTTQNLLDYEKEFWANRPLSDINFDALHCAMTVLVHMSHTERKWSKARHSPFYLTHGADKTLKQTKSYAMDPDKVVDDELLSILSRYRAILDVCYKFALSESRDLIDLIESVPGLLVVPHGSCLDISEVPYLFGIDAGHLAGLLQSSKRFLNLHNDGVSLNPHFIDYLCDQGRSGKHYRDPKPLHLTICQRNLSITFETRITFAKVPSLHSWDNSDDSGIGHHFFVTDIVQSDDTTYIENAIWPFVKYLNTVTFYRPTLYGPRSHSRSTWSYILHVLRWVQRQQKTIRLLRTHQTLEKELDRVIDRIYGQILSVERSPSGGVVSLRPQLLS